MGSLCDFFENEVDNIEEDVILDTSWKNEWIGMPEFVQEKQKPFSTIIVRFETEDDLQEFSKLIGQKLTSKTKSIWHPQLVRGINSGKRWKDES